MSALADVSVESHDDLTVAGVEGEIDRSNASEIATALLRGMPNVAVALVLDLTRTTYVDSSGVHLLFDTAARLRKRQQQLRVVVPPDARIRRLLSVVALEGTVPLHDTLEDAIAASRLPAEPSD